MKPPESRKAELAPNATGGKKSRAEAAESAEFKMTELGPIPVDWEVKRLGDLFELSAAGDLQTECSSRIKTDINIHPIYSNGLEDAGLYGYTSKPRYRADSITITGRGTLGHAEYRTLDFDAIIRLIVMRPSKRLDGRYVAFQINYSNPFHFEITSIPQLTVPQVAQALIPFPPLPEQRRIARALSDVDELISALGKLIEKKRNIKTGAMQELLGMRNSECGMRNVPRRRLPGFSGEWVEKRLGDYAIVARGGSPRPIEAFLTSHNDGLNWVKIGDVGVGAKYIERTAEKILPSGLSSTRMVYPGDFLLSNSMSFGRPYIMKITGCIHDGWLVIQDYKTTFDTEYLYYVLGSEMVVNQYRVLAAGSSVLNLNKDVVASVTVVEPPTLAEQKAIAGVLSDMDAEIAALEAKRAKYESIKQGMMQELLTGKTRLKGE